MQQLPEQLKTMIHHILHRYKFYRLQLSQYHQILQLLHQPRIDDPILIQQLVFKGIVSFNRAHKDQIAPLLASEHFQHISHETKSLMHKILHEFHFLNSIRAYEMFQERFQQPAAMSLGNEGGFNLPFDDELEKARLHYMYYGPYSIYHMNGLMPQTMNNTQPFLPSPNFYVPNELAVPRSSQDESKNAVKSAIKTPFEKELMSKHQELERHFGPTRGRPPKDKKKQLQKYNSSRISDPLRNLLCQYHSEQDIMQERDETLQYCICRGFLSSPYISKCSQCNRSYHYDCCRGGEACAGCELKTKDPFSQVTDTLGLFYLDWWDGFSFEVQINFKDSEKICSIGRFEVMVSCTLTHQEDITWPDGAVLKINGEEVFSVPPLLAAHEVRRRRDTSHFITPYIFGQKTDTPGSLDRTKVSLEAAIPPSPLPLRDNRRGIFLFGIFLVEKLSIDKLFNGVLNDNRLLPIINPIESTGDDVQIDRIVVSCYDPYTKQLMETPVRGKHCQHINCFDLQTFLAFQYHSDRTWRCPLCRKDARCLVVDKFQLRILEEIKGLDKLPHRITYHRGGKIDLQQAEGDSSSPSL